ncbi:MAG: hypothetical protein M1830_006680, partial [Pleopsidium flavum]
MLHFDTLKFYSVPCLPSDWRPPRWLVRDLGIFAGRLYFDFAEYPSICEVVRLPPHNALSSVEDGVETEKIPKPFTKAPPEFLQQWLLTRRKGQDFSHTPMGNVCCGKEVKEDSVYLACPGKVRDPA